MSHVPQGTRRNIHSLTPILIIGHPLSTSSIYYDLQHPFCLLICMHGSLWQSFVSSNHVDRLTRRTLSTQSCNADVVCRHTPVERPFVQDYLGNLVPIWILLGHMQVCTSLQTYNHANTPPLSFYRPDALPAAQPMASKH